LLVDLPIEKIESNPFNPRANRSSSDVDRLARSLERNGQLSPVRVRQSSRHQDKFELVFGHRRVAAARKLGWNSIRAELVSSASDQIAAVESLIENLERKDISDYEKGIIFERIKREFDLSFAEIGRMIGLSRQHISNYSLMVNLFDSKTLSSNPQLQDAMFKISEHHSRILSRVKDQNTRADLALRIVKDELSVRELSNILGRLRSWFTIADEEENFVVDQLSKDKAEISTSKDRVADSSKISGLEFFEDKDREKISETIRNNFEFAEKRDYEGYKRTRLFQHGFTMFSAFPPLQRLSGKEAMSRERVWFYTIAPKFQIKVQDLHVDVFDETGLATFSVVCRNRKKPHSVALKMVATLVLRKLNGEWFVYHEHWTKFDPATKDFVRTEDILTK
jgi:ParB/RepB/Spo0J family partition protein